MIEERIKIIEGR